jgi:hypothetical protein
VTTGQKPDPLDVPYSSITIVRVWINKDVDLPQALITAQRDGRLVVFAVPACQWAPSNLPSFSALATAIAAGVLTPKAGEHSIRSWAALNSAAPTFKREHAR